MKFLKMLTERVTLAQLISNIIVELHYCNDAAEKEILREELRILYNIPSNYSIDKINNLLRLAYTKKCRNPELYNKVIYDLLSLGE